MALVTLEFTSRARSSVVERSAHNRLVTGSNPVEPTITYLSSYTVISSAPPQMEGFFLFRADGYSELFHALQLALEVSGLRPSTIKHDTTDGRKFLGYYPNMSSSEITSIHIRQYLVLLKKKVSVKTVYEVQLALRIFGEMKRGAFFDLRNYLRKP